MDIFKYMESSKPKKIYPKQSTVPLTSKETEKSKDKPKIFQNVSVTNEPTKRRTDISTVQANIAEITQPVPLAFPYSVVATIAHMTGFENKTLLSDFVQVQKDFQELGIEIPEHILAKHFKPEEGVVSYITKEEAVELINLVIMHFREMEQKNLGPFQLEDIILEIIKPDHGMTKMDAKNLLAINQTFHDILLNKEIQKFQNEVAVKGYIYVNKNSIKTIIDLMERLGPNQTLDFFHKFRFAFNFKIDKTNFELVQKFLDLSGKKCPNLTSLDIGQLNGNITLRIPDVLKNLVQVGIHNLSNGSKVELPSKMEKLDFLSLSLIDKESNVILPTEMENLACLSLSNILTPNIIVPQELPKLKSLGLIYPLEYVLEQISAFRNRLYKCGTDITQDIPRDYWVQTSAILSMIKTIARMTDSESKTLQNDFLQIKNDFILYGFLSTFHLNYYFQSKEGVVSSITKEKAAILIAEILLKFILMHESTSEIYRYMPGELPFLKEKGIAILTSPSPGKKQEDIDNFKSMIQILRVLS